MTSCSPASEVNECGDNHVCLPICCVLCDPCQYCYACEQKKCEAAGLDLTIGDERCPRSRRLGARLPLFGHSYEEPDACPPIPSGCPRDIASVDDDTCEEDIEDPPTCRGLTGPVSCRWDGKLADACVHRIIENCKARFRLKDWLDGRPIQSSCGLAHGMADSPVHWSQKCFVAKRLPERRPDPATSATSPPPPL